MIVQQQFLQARAGHVGELQLHLGRGDGGFAAFGDVLFSRTGGLHHLVDGPVTTLIYSAVVGGAVSSALLPSFWVTPDLRGWLQMALLGVLGGIGHFTLIRALSLAPAGTVAPLSYTSLVWSTGFGFVLFDHLPDGWTLVGATVIIGSGFYVFRREQRLKRNE